MSDEANPRLDSLTIHREVSIAAPIQTTFEAILDQLGPAGEMPDGKPFPMVLEAKPGGRWFRDLGDDAGHLWGHVQVIKPPTLLEITGPLMMSYAAANHLQYRLQPDGENTRLLFTHTAIGLIQPEHREGLSEGWAYWIDCIAKHALRKTT